MAATVFSTQLQKLRKTKGVKQEQLAEHLGVSTQAVSKWENGSYPDGALLPGIAQFFDVSIDYLYGNETKDKCLQEQVKDDIVEKRLQKDARDGNLELTQDYLWAIQNGLLSIRMEDGYRNYKSVPVGNCTPAGSGVIFENGFSYMRLSEDLEYYGFLKIPKEGLEQAFHNPDSQFYSSVTLEELAKVFRCFSSKETIQILFYMMSLCRNESIRPEVIAKELEIPEETAKQALRELSEISPYCQFVVQTDLLLSEKEREQIYSKTLSNLMPAMLMLAAARDIVKPVASWHGLNMGDEWTWTDRKKVIAMGKEKHE